MKKFYFVLLIGFACMLAAAESPFKKGTTYLNFNLCSIGQYRNINDSQRLVSLATGMALEFGLTADLGLELQYYEHSFPGGEFAVIDSNNIINKYTIEGFKERVLSLGGNYHLNFIGIRRLDVYTGFQIGIEGKWFITPSHMKEELLPESPTDENVIIGWPINSANSKIQIYSHITTGLNYFITDKIAINLRSGLTLGGIGSEFFYGVGVTLKI